MITCSCSLPFGCGWSTCFLMALVLESYNLNQVQAQLSLFGYSSSSITPWGPFFLICDKLCASWIYFPWLLALLSESSFMLWVILPFLQKEVCDYNWVPLSSCFWAVKVSGKRLLFQFLLSLFLWVQDSSASSKTIPLKTCWVTSESYLGSLH